MTRTLVNALHPDDYSEIVEGVQAVQNAVQFLHHRGVRIEIPHTHRWWEYGTAVQLLLTHYKEDLPQIEVLDVGAGWGAVGPTLSLFYGTKVTECEPDLQCRQSRTRCNDILREQGKPEIDVTSRDILCLPDHKYDAVFCISVIEHLAPATEAACWRELVSRLKPNGLLFITMDCVPDPRKQYAFDNLRCQNFTMGMIPMGKPDYAYKGSFVFDYSFFRAGFVKNGSHITNDVERTVRDSGVRAEPGL
jgi:SAM-dependent methyltransferase